MSIKREDLVARCVPLVTTNDHVLERMSELIQLAT